MKKIAIQEDGFGVIEVLLIVVAVALVGFIGWWVYQQRNTTPSTSATVTKTTVQKTSPPLSSNETDSWLTFTSPTYNYTMRIPDGWKLLNDTGTGLLASGKQGDTSDITYSKGTTATVTKTTIADDALHRFTVSAGMPASSLANYTKGGTVQGVNATATKYTYTQTTEPAGAGLPKGAKETRYHFVGKDGKSVDVTYVIAAADTDNTATVEKAVATFTFL